MDDLRPHWAAGQLVFQRCGSCRSVQHPPGAACFRCHSRDVGVEAVTGQATVVSWSVVHRAPAPAFAADLPYPVLVVELAEGGLVEVRADVLGADHAWAVGLEVQLGLAEVAGTTLPMIVALA